MSTQFRNVRFCNTDPGGGQDQGAEVVCAALWRFWADVGGGVDDRMPRDCGECGDGGETLKRTFLLGVDRLTN